MRTYLVNQLERVNADAVQINMGTAVFFANAEEVVAPEYGMPSQPRLVLAIAPGEWSRIEEVQE